MTAQEKRTKLQKLNNKFLNKWIIKKSKNPFTTGNQKPAFFCHKITINRDSTISFGNGTRFKTSKKGPDPFEFLIDVSKDEAQHLNKLRQVYKGELELFFEVQKDQTPTNDVVMKETK
jgi:hypothetical protein